MPVYTNSTPGASEFPSVSQPLIQQNFQYLQSNIGYDHNFTGNSANAEDGMHKQVRFNAVQAAPGAAFAPGVSTLYAQTVAGVTALAMRNATGSFPITGLNPSIGASGYTCLPGNLLLQWGYITQAVAADVTFNWPIAFTTFLSATLTIVITTANNSLFVEFRSAPSAIAATVAILKRTDGTSVAGSFYYMAIGTKT